MKTVLLLVDLQHDFLQSGRYAGLVERVGAVVAAARAEGTPVIHVWTTVRRDGDNRMPHWRRQGKWLCVEGTPGHASPVPPLPGEPVVRKRFFSGFAGTGLEALLREMGACRVRIAGVQVQSCLRATAIDAYQGGFAVEIVEDASGSEEPLHAALTLDYLDARTVDALPGETGMPEVSGTVAAAREAGAVWARTDWRRRLTVLAECSERFDTGDLAERISRAVRKPAALAGAEARRAVALIRAAARLDPRDLPCGADARVRFRPLGVVALITPWNNPAAIPLGKIAPALALGNAVVWKPSPLDGGIAERVVELLGLGDLVQIVRGGAGAARMVMSEAGVDAVSLTGSEDAGWRARAICAARGIPLQAELGGNNAAVVWEEDDLRQAVRAVAEGAFSFAGQRCTANRRLIVPRSSVERVMSILREDLSAMPSLISTESKERISALLQRCAGRKLQGPAGGPGPDNHPAVVVLAGEAGSEIVQEESFGPVLVVQPADDFDHAMELCNGVRQGLTAAIFTGNPELRERFLESAQAGVLKVNRSTVDAGVEAPFGGWKSSGTGPPEHGAGNLQFYTRMQAVYE